MGSRVGGKDGEVGSMIDARQKSYLHLAPLL